MRSLPVIVLTAVVLSAVTAGCGGDKADTIDDINDTRRFPTMRTTDVSSFVSDSGYTRYHITAPVWLMFEEADTPYWTFPDGLFMEKYDDSMVTDATFRCDSATYFSSKKLWRFDGNVNMRNTEGDRFATPQLFWDQNRKIVYSDSFMHIDRADRVIEGYGFESDEAMTRYTILNPQMILPLDKLRSQRDTTAAQGSDVIADTTMAVVDPVDGVARPKVKTDTVAPRKERGKRSLSADAALKKPVRKSETIKNK